MDSDDRIYFLCALAASTSYIFAVTLTFFDNTLAVICIIIGMTFTRIGSQYDRDK